MQEILDDEHVKRPSLVHGKRSFLFFCFSVLSIIFLLGVVFLAYFGKNSFKVISVLFGIATLGFLIFSTLSFVFGVASVRAKEPWHWKKVVGLVGGTLFFLFFVAVIIANVIDVLKFME